MKNQNGFLNIGVWVVIAAAIIVGGWFLLKSEVAVAPTLSPSTNESSSPTGSPGSTSSPQTTPNGVICTADAKLCPDGSYVGRTGPKCEFRPCPALKMTTYTSAQDGFSVQYPIGWQVNSQYQGTVIFYKTPGDHKNEIYLGMENNPNQLSTSEWLKSANISTAGSTTFKVNGLTAIQLTDNTSIPTIHVYMATGDRVAHFFVESETDFMTIFNLMVASFKVK